MENVILIIAIILMIYVTSKYIGFSFSVNKEGYILDYPYHGDNRIVIFAEKDYWKVKNKIQDAYLREQGSLETYDLMYIVYGTKYTNKEHNEMILEYLESNPCDCESCKVKLEKARAKI